MRKFAIAAAALLGSSATAQDMPQTSPGRFHCAGEPGKNYNQEIVPLKLGEEMRIAFRMLKENDQDPKHPPTASVLFHTSDGETAVSVGQALGDRYHMYAQVRTPRTTQWIYEYRLTHDWIILKLKLDKRGLLTVRSSESTPRFEVGSTDATSSHLNCHSGDWEIDVWPRSYVLPRPTL